MYLTLLDFRFDYGFSSDGSITTEFEETPLMSTYLVAFIVSDFGHLSSSQPRDVPQRTFAR